jgi:hypothetical protein
VSHLLHWGQISGTFWKGVRVVDGNGLENRRAGNGTVGSNPTPSASQCYLLQCISYQLVYGMRIPG